MVVYTLSKKELTKSVLVIEKHTLIYTAYTKDDLFGFRLTVGHYPMTIFALAFYVYLPLTSV